MKTLPSTVKAYKQTPEFNQQTVPKGLLANHKTKAGTWGKIIVLEGQLQYTIEAPQETLTLSSEKYGVVEPEVLHHVKPLGPVRFYVEFYH